MSHPFVKASNCNCNRCTKERARREHQSTESKASVIFKRPIKTPRLRRAVYIDPIDQGDNLGESPDY